MPRQTIDVEAAEKAIRESLAKLRETERPGVRRNGGTKMDALIAAKDAIVALMDEGYTAAQIADAIKSGNAGFGILPKTITQLAGKKQQPKTPKAPRKTKTMKTTTKATTTDEQPTNPGGFKLDSDEV